MSIERALASSQLGLPRHDLPHLGLELPLHHHRRRPVMLLHVVQLRQLRRRAQPRGHRLGPRGHPSCWSGVTWAAVTHKAMFLSLGLFFLGLFSLLQHFSHQLGHKHNKQEEALQKQN